MIEILQFVFSSFWVWFGTLCLISAFGGAIASVLLAVRGKSGD